MKRLLLAFFLVCGNANAAEWVIVAEHNAAKFYLDALSVKEEGRYRTAWLMLDYSEPRRMLALPDAHYISAKQLLYFDCAKRASAVGQASFHAANMGQGEILEKYSTDRAKLSFSRHLPDTLKETVLDVVCSLDL